jgi:hypothetical protein
MPDYDNSGILSKNDRKTEDFHAEYKGNATVAGVAYWLDAKVGEKDGRKFFLLKFKPKDQPKPVATEPAWKIPDRDDDIPF